MLKSGLLLSGANITNAILSLTRNVVVARLISVEDFGIATTFILTMSLVEMVSYVAVERLLVQDKEGDAPHLLATAHTIQLARGAAGTIVLFLASQPIAALFGVPDAAWAYAALAPILLLRGLMNLDLFRLQREMQFVPFVSVEVAAQAVSTVAAAVLAYVLADYRAILFALLLQQLTHTTATHLVARRPYLCGWNAKIALRIGRFGWPLLLNGFLIFGIFQGDRIIVGSHIGMVELGWFSVAFSLTLMPTMLAASTLQTFFLPQLARAQDRPAEFEHLAQVTIQVTLMIGAALAVMFALAGPVVLITLYGPRYETSLSILTLLAVMHSVRFAKAGPAVVALAKARTDNPLIANITRFLTLFVAWYLVHNGAGVVAVVVVGIAGEGLAFAVSLTLLRGRLRLALAPFAAPVLAVATTLGLVCIDAWLWPPTASLFDNLHWFQIVLLLGIAPVVWFMPAMWAWAWSLVRKSTAR